jgi:hypothetical protein
MHEYGDDDAWCMRVAGCVTCASTSPADGLLMKLASVLGGGCLCCLGGRVSHADQLLLLLAVCCYAITGQDVQLCHGPVWAHL